jgi:glutamate-5-semialdehyde dehydrogenase
MSMQEMGQRARAAARPLARASADQKNAGLAALADRLMADRAEILAANAKDVSAAQAGQLSPAMLDRLTLDEARLAGMASDLRAVAALPDPVGQVFDATTLPNGLAIHKQRVPIGVLGVIYEARPNVTVDVAGLVLKTGNVVILRGGSESLNSNRALVAAVQRALADSHLPADAVQFVDDADRARVTELLALDEYVDMIIPRGGAGLHRFCREHSRIPVITGGIGICHLFVDESADLDAALNVIYNAKVQRPTVCNALDTAQSIAPPPRFLPRLVNHLGAAGVTFRADVSAQSFLPADPRIAPPPDDFDTGGLRWSGHQSGGQPGRGIKRTSRHMQAIRTASDSPDAHAALSRGGLGGGVCQPARYRWRAAGLGAEVAISPTCTREAYGLRRRRTNGSSSARGTSGRSRRKSRRLLKESHDPSESNVAPADHADRVVAPEPPLGRQPGFRNPFL